MMDLRVARLRAIARDIVLVELETTDKRPLPGAEAGAHIDLHLPSGLVRQYSLTNAVGDATMAGYQIAVGLDAASRGGSSWIHDKLKSGSTLKAGLPRNHFALEAAHQKVLLLAGGIGITPVYAMAQVAQRRGLDWQLLACGRSLSRIAFAEELLGLDASRVHFHGDLESRRRADFSTWLNEAEWDGVYACGPQPMLDDLIAQTSAWAAGRFRYEKFKAAAVDTSAAAPFELVLARSGLNTTVEPGEQVLDAIERLGVAHPFACREGLCGTCECALLDGEPDHRDSVLDEGARQSGRFIPCVSRARGNRLTLDL